MSGDIFPCESRMTTKEFRKGYEDMEWEDYSERDGCKEDQRTGEESRKGQPRVGACVHQGCKEII